MITILTNIISALAGVAFIYIPFAWCHFRHEDTELYGLSWKMQKGHFLEFLILTTFVLVSLTFVSVNWPFEKLPRHSSLGRILNLGASGIGAAIIEEIFYRGWVQQLFKKKFSVFWAVIFTSAIFALSHVFVTQTLFLIAVFFPGCLMGFLRERHGNIATSTLFHAVSNIWAIWFAPLTWPTLEWVAQTLS
jgi:membrane protease YdiL (CAAX protease family)